MNGSRSIQYIVRTMTRPFSRSKPTPYINKSNVSSRGHVIRRWRNRFNSNGWDTKYCSDLTTARNRAMLDPCELGDYTRISLRCISTHVNIRKPRGSQRWIEGIACLLFIRRYRRSRGTWEYGIFCRKEKIFHWEWQKGRYIIENRIDALIDELSIDKNRTTSVSHQSAAWNVKKMATTALLYALSITPYIYINLGSGCQQTKLEAPS